MLKRAKAEKDAVLRDAARERSAMETESEASKRAILAQASASKMEVELMLKEERTQLERKMASAAAAHQEALAQVRFFSLSVSLVCLYSP